MSLFKKIQKLVKKEPEVIPAPDLSRVLAPEDLPSAPHKDAETKTVDIDLAAWLEQDLQSVAEALAKASKENIEAGSVEALRKAVHNLHGASGAYGGGALTRLTGSLQKLITRDHDVQTQTALINLHVQACQAASLATADEDDPIAMAVCDSLEEQVDRVITARVETAPI